MNAECYSNGCTQKYDSQNEISFLFFSFLRFSVPGREVIFPRSIDQRQRKAQEMMGKMEKKETKWEQFKKVGL